MKNVKNISWRPFKKDWITYDLSHLHPNIFSVNVEWEKLNRKEIRVHISFSSHVFTSKFRPEKHEKTDRYFQCLEWRFFCFERYFLSKIELMNVINDFVENPLNNRIYKWSLSDYLKIKLVSWEEYLVYFRLEKNKLKTKSNKNDLVMIITSAHINEFDKKLNRKKDRNSKKLKTILIQKFLEPKK